MRNGEWTRFVRSAGRRDWINQSRQPFSIFFLSSFLRSFVSFHSVRTCLSYGNRQQQQQQLGREPERTELCFVGPVVTRFSQIVW